ncbi:MAG: hypothetical protein Q7U10_11160 [Thermodesulfovibrionia bacterium]|nr:hypothetical protein [Thermodesulfovibrionia bacterium]
MKKTTDAIRRESCIAGYAHLVEEISFLPLDEQCFDKQSCGIKAITVIIKNYQLVKQI